MALTVFLAGLGVPVMAGNRNLDAGFLKMEILGEKSDDPWDPGDESAPSFGGKSDLSNVTPGLEFKTVIAEKKEDPWDPGDETPCAKRGGDHG